MPQKILEKYLTEEELLEVHTTVPLKTLPILGFLLMWIAGGAASLYGAGHSGVVAKLLWTTGIFASAFAINAAFLVMHEGTHYLLARNPTINRWLGFLTGLPLFLSFSAYQALHIRHHEFLGDPRDPDDYNNYTGHPVKVWFLHWLRLFAAGYIYLLLVPVLAWKHSSRQRRMHILLDYGLLGIFYAGLLSLIPFSVLAQVWLYPILVVNFLVNARGLTQHSLADASDPLMASRSILTHPMVAFLYLNENYHLEHHLYPGVPFYNLPRLHTLLIPRLPRALAVPSYSWFVIAFIKASLRGHKGPIGRLIGPETEVKP